MKEEGAGRALLLELEVALVLVVLVELVVFVPEVVLAVVFAVF